MTPIRPGTPPDRLASPILPPGHAPGESPGAALDPAHAGAEGELRIRVLTRGGTVAEVVIESTRPRVAQALLDGQDVALALARVPALFSVCGRAQAAAAAMAVDAARGNASAPAGAAAPVDFDLAQDTLWRVLIDWHRGAGEAPDTAALATARMALNAGDTAALRAVVERSVLGGPAEAWRDQHLPGFEIWLASAPTPAARFLVAVQRDGPRHGAGKVPLLRGPHDPAQRRLIVQGLVADPQFDAQPHLDGAAAETGALARMLGHPLIAALHGSYGSSTLTRLVARLAELARIAAGQPPAEPLAGAHALGPGAGIGWVETARGLLIHAVELDGAQVRCWRIVAPTEWNFHPQGALVAGLLGVHVPAAELRRRAEWLVQALDPCVPWRLDFAEV